MKYLCILLLALPMPLKAVNLDGEYAHFDACERIFRDLAAKMESETQQDRHPLLDSRKLTMTQVAAPTLQRTAGYSLKPIVPREQRPRMRYGREISQEDWERLWDEANRLGAPIREPSHGANFFVDETGEAGVGLGEITRVASLEHELVHARDWNNWKAALIRENPGLDPKQANLLAYAFMESPEGALITETRAVAKAFRTLAEEIARKGDKLKYDDEAIEYISYPYKTLCPSGKRA